MQDGWRGIMAVSVTPFDDELEVDLAAVGTVLAPLGRAAVEAAVVNGNTGEYYALSSRERVALLAEAAKVIEDGTDLVAGVGGDLPTAIAEAAEAAANGYTGVMVHHPAHPFVSTEGWVTYHRAIARAVPDLAVLPYVKGGQVTGQAIGRLHADCPNVVGVKYAVPDPLGLATAIDRAEAPSIAWFCGLAESWAPFFAAAGTVGFTSGLVNVTTGPSRALLVALREGDGEAAMRTWRAVRPFEELRARHGDANNVAVVKEVLHQLGRCTRQVRPPASPLVPAERAEATALLSALGLA